MHFVFSYDLGVEAGSRRNEIENKIVSFLPEKKYTKKLNNFYIVSVSDQNDWDNLLKSLQEYSQAIPEKLHFIMSPLIDGGRYNGILAKGEWADINLLSQE